MSFLLFFFLSLHCLFAIEQNTDFLKLILEPDSLVVSNFPEKVAGPGFIGDFLLDMPSIRFIYHHENIYFKKLKFFAVIKNKTNQNQSFTFFQGLGGPSSDFVYSGYRSALLFWRDLLGGGQRVLLGPFESKVLISHLIAPAQAISGLLKLTDYLPDSLMLSLFFLDHEYPSLLPKQKPQLNNYFQHVLLKRAYLSSYFFYRCGDGLETIQIGGRPFLKDHMSDFSLQGNYGVIYSISLVLKNPYPKAVSVQLLKGPLGLGVHRGVFLIDGNLYSSGVTNRDHDYYYLEKIAQFYLKPFSSRRVQIYTMPISGGIYPIELMLRCIR